MRNEDAPMKQERQVKSAMDDIEIQFKRTNQLSDTLRDRLEIVMNRHDPAAGERAEEVPNVSDDAVAPLAVELYGVANRMSHHNDVLDGWIRRLEI